MRHDPLTLIATLATALAAAGCSEEVGTDAPPPRQIDQVLLYQTLEIPLVSEGVEVPVRDIPVIVGKPTNVCVRLAAPIDPGLGDAVITLTVGGFTAQGDAVAGDVDLPELCLIVPGESIELDSGWEISASSSETGEQLAWWPRTDLEARDPGPLDLVMLGVDLSYPSLGIADASELTAQEVEELGQRIGAQMPAGGTAATFDPEPIVFATDDLGQRAWLHLLNELGSRRLAAGASDPALYVGIVPGDRSVSSTIAGIAPRVGRTRTVVSQLRWGEADALDETTSTLIQELGHLFGRSHAPCGDPDAVDPLHPSPDGTRTTRGWDAFSRRFIEIEDAFPSMSYCSPTWPHVYAYVRDYRSIRDFNELAGLAIDRGDRPTDHLIHAYDRDTVELRGRAMGLTGGSPGAVAGAAVCTPDSPDIPCVEARDDGLWVVDGLAPGGDEVITIELDGFVPLRTRLATWVGPDTINGTTTLSDGDAGALADQLGFDYPLVDVGILAITTATDGVEVSVSGQPRPTVYLDPQFGPTASGIGVQGGLALILDLPAGTYAVDATWNGGAHCFDQVGPQVPIVEAELLDGWVTLLPMDCALGWPLGG